MGQKESDTQDGMSLYGGAQTATTEGISGMTVRLTTAPFGCGSKVGNQKETMQTRPDPGIGKAGSWQGGPTKSNKLILVIKISK